MHNNMIVSFRANFTNMLNDMIYDNNLQPIFNVMIITFKFFYTLQKGHSGHTAVAKGKRGFSWPN